MAGAASRLLRLSSSRHSSERPAITPRQLLEIRSLTHCPSATARSAGCRYAFFFQQAIVFSRQWRNPATLVAEQLRHHE